MPGRPRAIIPGTNTGGHRELLVLGKASPGQNVTGPPSRGPAGNGHGQGLGVLVLSRPPMPLATAPKGRRAHSMDCQIQQTEFWGGFLHLRAGGLSVCTHRVMSLSGFGITGRPAPWAEWGSTPSRSLVSKRSLGLDSLSSVNARWSLPVKPSRPRVFFAGRF